MINPLVRIALLIFLAILLPTLRGIPLALLTSILLCCAVLCSAADFGRFLRRARWLLISILCIYAYFTPGEYLSGVPDVLAPTLEGLREGGLQVMRLASILAAISLLLAMTTREHLVAGIRQMLLPLRVFNFSPDRFAVRLWLTLHYVEHWPPGLLRHGPGRLLAMPELKAGPDRIELVAVRWRAVDVLVIGSLPFLWWGLH